MIASELRAWHSLWLWITRRRHGVPVGATAVPYSREQSTTLMMWLFAMVVETVGVDLLLLSVGVPGWLGYLILALDVYGVMFAVTFLAACVTRPHVVTDEELCVRLGPYVDLRIPIDTISAVRQVRSFDDKLAFGGEKVSVAVSSQTNVVVELAEPVDFVRPLGKPGRATSVRFFADDPAAAVRSLRTAGAGSALPLVHRLDPGDGDGVPLLDEIGG